MKLVHIETQLCNLQLSIGAKRALLLSKTFRKFLELSTFITNSITSTKITEDTSNQETMPNFQDSTRLRRTWVTAIQSFTLKNCGITKNTILKMNLKQLVVSNQPSLAASLPRVSSTTLTNYTKFWPMELDR